MSEDSNNINRLLGELRRLADAKSAFLATMSHEMLTPLNAIIGMTAVGKKAADAERKNYALEKIEEASMHLLGVVSDLLDMQKIEADELTLSPAEFNLEHMLQKLVTVIGYRVKEKQQHFTAGVAKDVPHFVIGDEQRLSQVVMNLLSNAVKFTPEGGDIELSVSLAGKADGVNEIEFEVSDSGIGITPEQQKRLFAAFEQAEHGLSREFGGTGLGLAISKRIVEMMDGGIWLESEPGVGSRFTFTVKLADGKEDLRLLLRPGIKWDDIRVLAVDDSGIVRRFYIDSFDRLGVHCETAADSASACRMVEESGAFDVCFIDWRMPGMDGIELSQWIKERGDGSAVVLISSADRDDMQEAVLRAGADMCLVKPFLSYALVDCVNKCLGRRVGDNTGGGAAGQTAAYGPAGEFSGKTLLFAEDIEINREIVISLLEGTGLDIECAGNGREAVEMLKANPDKYDIVFMDMQMPHMDGLEATRLIRALPAKRFREIPIIAMTANVFKDDIANCLAAGMNDHIAKPIDLSDMFTKLRRHIA